MLATSESPVSLRHGTPKGIDRWRGEIAQIVATSEWLAWSCSSADASEKTRR
jgi:hypothetical protein